MKKLFVVLMAVFMVASVAGCGQQATESVKIPKYDPGKTSTDGQPVTNNGVKDPVSTVDEPEFPKATPATEWTMFRRTPDNMGVVDADIKLPLKKGKDQYRIIPFGAPQSNPIYGTPVVKNGRIYFGTHIGYVSCNKFDTGEPIWKNQEPVDPILSSFAATDKRVFFGTARGHFYSYDYLADIKLWSFKTGDNISAPPGETKETVKQGRIVDGPKIVGDKIYFGAWDGNMYCLDTESGKVVWTFKTTSKIYASPAISDGKLYFTNFKGEVYCLDLEKGAQVWKIALPKGTISSPVVFGSRLWVGCRDSKLYCLSVKDGKTLWSYQAPDVEFGIECCPVIDETNVYFGTTGGYTCALNRKTGKEIWKAKTAEAGLHSDPLVVRNMLIFGDLKGNLFVIDKKSGKTLDSFLATGSNPVIWASPLIIGNSIIFSCYDSNVYIVSGQ